MNTLQGISALAAESTSAGVERDTLSNQMSGRNSSTSERTLVRVRIFAANGTRLSYSHVFEIAMKITLQKLHYIYSRSLCLYLYLYLLRHNLLHDQMRHRTISCA